jgi:ribonuclease Z
MMKRSVKLWGRACLLLVVLGALAWWQRGPITVALMQRQVSALTSISDPLAGLVDGLHVGLCGAGSPFPDAKRSGPCTVVVAGQRMFVFDAGSGASRNLALMRLNAGQIEALFLTHFHSDHIDGLGELMMQRWIQRTAQQALPVHGPEGLEKVLQGFNDAYTLDKGYRIGHHGEAVAPNSGFGGLALPFTLPADTGRKVLLSEPDLEIVAFRVSHGPVHPAVGYRVRYKDRTLVISGDTSKSAAVQRESMGVDLLLHEALSPPLLGVVETGFADAGRAHLAKIMHDVLNYHTTPEEAAEIAVAANVKALVFNHIVPPLPLSGLEQSFAKGAQQIYKGPLRIGTDGDWFTLATGSTAIEMGKRP